MIPFLPGRRSHRPDDPHTRARRLAADRLAGALDPADDAWLVAHLEGCEPCSAVADAYAEQRSLLKGLAAPVPPRDLWARTRAAVELESGASRSGRRSTLIPLGALSGALVVAVVVGASVLSMPAVNTPVTTPVPTIRASTPPSQAPVPTPIAVTAGDVGWLLQRDDGTYALSYAAVDKVCTAESAPDCPPLDAPTEGTLVLAAAPRAILASPTDGQLVVVDAGTREGGGTVYVVAAPGPDPTSEPSAPPASPSPAASTSPDPSPSPEPTASPAPPASAEPSSTPMPSSSPIATGQPSASPSVGPSASPSTDLTQIAIADDVIVVGESAAYSADGHWFAFAARPADGTSGPDIYVWRAGLATAQPVTSDGRSVFAAWIGDRILGSRAVLPDGAPASEPSATPSAEPRAGASVEPSREPSTAATTVSFLLDPETGLEEALEGAGIYRPVVDPTGRYAVYWEGTLEVDPTGVEWRPGVGRLVVAAWDATATERPSGSVAPDASASPAAAASPDASASPAGSPVAPASPSPVVSSPVGLTEGSIRDWDIHWDEDGALFAIWLADPMDPTIGSLTLHELDRTTGSLAADGPVIADVPAVAGFSIGDGRLAWATPPGQDGQGSRLQVLAWSGKDAGLTESRPGTGSDPIVVVR